MQLIPRFPSLTKLSALCLAATSLATQAVEIVEKPDSVTIENKFVRVELNLKTSTYNIVDVRDGTVAIANAHAEVDGLGSLLTDWTNRRYDPKSKLTWTAKEISDDLGRGKTLTLNNLRSDGMEFLTTFTVREGKGFVALGLAILSIIRSDWPAYKQISAFFQIAS